MNEKTLKSQSAGCLCNTIAFSNILYSPGSGYNFTTTFFPL
jgi:hypothetical protein